MSPFGTLMRDEIVPGGAHTNRIGITSASDRFRPGTISRVRKKDRSTHAIGVLCTQFQTTRKCDPENETAASRVPRSFVFALKGQHNLARGKRSVAPGSAQHQESTLKGWDTDLSPPGNCKRVCRTPLGCIGFLSLVPGRRPLRSLAPGYVVLPLQGKDIILLTPKRWHLSCYSLRKLLRRLDRKPLTPSRVTAHHIKLFQLLAPIA